MHCYNHDEPEIEVTKKQLGEASSHLFDSTAYGDIRPGDELPRGVPKTFLYKIRALDILLRPDSPSLVWANLSAFTDLYDAISSDEDTWLHFLDHPYHSTHAEHTAYVLLALISVHRTKRDLSSVENVLFLCYEVIKKIRANDTRYNIAHYYEREYYYLCERKMDVDMCVHLYRKICLYELDHQHLNKAGEFTIFLSAMLKREVTPEVVQDMSDETLLWVILTHRS